MNILFLDDQQSRHDAIAKYLIGYNLVHVYTAIECIEHLDKHNWDAVFLDHDLGGHIYVDSKETNTGAEVARWLKEHPDRQPPHMYIHSFNPVGAMDMWHNIPKAIIKPISFVYQDIKQILDKINNSH